MLRWMILVSVSVTLLASTSCNDVKVEATSQPVFDLGGPAAQADGSFDYDLTVVFTNDFHDQIEPVGATGRGGLARHATLMQLLRDEATTRGKALLACNAGDAFEGSLYYETSRGSLLLRLLDQMGYDVFQVGNHDHQFGVQFLYDVFVEAFPGLTQNLKVIWGNVNPSGMSVVGTDPMQANALFLPAQVTPEVVDAFENAFVAFDSDQIDPTLMDAPLANSKLFNQTLFFDRGGVRIGVFGLDTDEALFTSVPGEGDLFLDADDRAENLRFQSPVTSSYASQVIDYLDDPDQDPTTDDGADVILCVTHIGTGVDLQVAAQTLGTNGRQIDVLVGGHTHDRFNTSIPVPHGSGRVTHIVQAGCCGEFLGRIDLAIDPVTNTVDVANAQLLQVDDRLAGDPAAQMMIDEERTRPGGVDATFSNPFDTVVADNTERLPGGLAAPTSLGTLTAEAMIAAVSAAGTGVNLDAALVGNFVFRADLGTGPVTRADVQATLPLHALDRTGTRADTVHLIELPGGLRQAANPSTFPVPAPNLQNITALEYFLEVIFSVEDLLTVVGGFFGFDLGGISGFIEGIQWGGIEFVIDANAPPFERIDPASIVVGGVPLVGNENTTWRFGINAVIAEIALPFVQLLTSIEGTPGTGLLLPFPDYDPTTNETGIVVWEALADHMQTLGTLDGDLVRVDGTTARTRGPDLTFNVADVVVTGSAPNVMVSVPVINIGETAVASAELEVRLDRTPDDATDDPDGVTDMATGFEHELLAVVPIGAVPAFGSGAPGTTTASTSIAVPAELATFGLRLRVRQVVSVDLSRPETVTANNRASDAVRP